MLQIGIFIRCVIRKNFLPVSGLDLNLLMVSLNVNVANFNKVKLDPIFSFMDYFLLSCLA